MKLNKTKVYSLKDLTNDEWKKLTNSEKCAMSYYEFVDGVGWVFKSNENFIKEIINAKELFYTLENIQVDCRDLSEEQIRGMAYVFDKSGYFVNYGSLHCIEDACFLHNDRIDCSVYYQDDTKTTITYSKFMELFTAVATESIQPHYDNTNGSIYKFCNDQKLNSWEFDIIKRVVRCRKKGLFKEDLQKTKDLIDLYLKEWK